MDLKRNVFIVCGYFFVKKKKKKNLSTCEVTSMQSGCIVNLKHIPTVQSNFRRNSTDMRYKNEFLESRL